jgi:hypothetical protein
LWIGLLKHCLLWKVFSGILQSVAVSARVVNMLLEIRMQSKGLVATTSHPFIPPDANPKHITGAHTIDIRNLIVTILLDNTEISLREFISFLKRFIYLFTYLFTYLFIHLFVYLFIYSFLIYSSIYLIN